MSVFTGPHHAPLEGNKVIYRDEAIDNWTTPGDENYNGFEPLRWFGSMGDDTVNYSINPLDTGQNDSLYGLRGNDTIYAGEGEDYIEGGQGQDTMYGGGGNDTFYVQGEDTDYDIFYGDSGEQDKIIGSDNIIIKDVFRFQHFNYATNSIEQIDGKAGENIIAGTNKGNVIDLSGTELLNIKEIRGGGGEDTITGSSSNDNIYGGELGDTLKGMGGDDTLYGLNDDLSDDNVQDQLEGGEGNDTYHVGAGDVISDIDNNGTIFLNGQELTGLTFTQVSEGSIHYTTDDNSYRAIHDDVTGALTVTAVDNPKFFSIENFSSGGYGITLEDWAPPAGGHDFYLTGTGYRDEMWMITGSSNPTGWVLYMTSYPNEIPGDSTEIFARQMTSNAPGLEVSGGENGDFLFGFTASDKIIGRGGSDIITGHMGWWGGTPLYQNETSQGDLLKGGEGNDWVRGGNGSDQIDGGTGNDYMQSYDGCSQLRNYVFFSSD